MTYGHTLTVAYKSEHPCGLRGLPGPLDRGCVQLREEGLVAVLFDARKELKDFFLRYARTHQAHVIRN